MTMPFCQVEEALLRFSAGKMVILVDDENRENEGDLIIAAEKISPEAINFMASYGRGLICLSMAESLVDRLELPMMVQKNDSPYQTAFTVSIEAREGVTTGISAKDRARTIQAAVAADVKPADIVSPGHVFPLRARKGGVLVRTGQTEGSVDLARMSGLTEAAVICEIINEDGTMARRGDLEVFSQQHDIPILTIKDLIAYRMKTEVIVNELASSALQLKGLGEFEIKIFGNECDDLQHVALVKKPFNGTPLVRVHSECLTGDIFSSARCDCGEQLDTSLSKIAEQGGVLVYMKQEGRGIGLVNKIKAYALQQEKGLDTVEANKQLGFPADQRDYAISAQILKYLGVCEFRLLTNNPRKINGLTEYGMTITERMSLVVEPDNNNQAYLETKKIKLGHLLAQ